MTTIKLNKPLYDDKPKLDEQETQFVPRAPRPSVWPKAAALVVDLLFLHVVCLGITKFFPNEVASLGEYGQVAGLLLAFVYVTLSTRFGRTVGALLLRMEIRQLSGEPPTWNQSLIRSAVLILPVVILLAAQRAGAAADVPDKLTITAPLFSYLGGALLLSYFFANFAWNTISATGRMLHDKVSGLLVITADSPVNDQVEFTRMVRTAPPAPTTLQLIVTVIAGLLPVGLIVALVMTAHQEITREPKNVAAYVQMRTGTQVAGFGPSIPSRLIATNPEEKETTAVLGSRFEYIKRGRVTTEDILNNPQAVGVVDKIAVIMTQRWYETVEEQRKTAKPDEIKAYDNVRQLVFQVDFQQSADLFFGSTNTSVFSTSRSVELKKPTPTVPKAPAATEIKSETAETSPSKVSAPDTPTSRSL